MRSILGLVSLIPVSPCFSYQFYHIAMVESCNNTFGFILALRYDGAWIGIPFMVHRAFSFPFFFFLTALVRFYPY